jgi:hypothetical protein
MGQPCGVADQEPKLGIVGSALRGALGVIERLPEITLSQSEFCGSRQARILNIGSPSEGLFRGLRLTRSRLRIFGTGGPYLVNLGVCGAREPDTDEYPCKLQRSESNRQGASPTHNFR